MKYICKRNCYVMNPKGTLQYFREGEVVEYPAGKAVAEHFERADGKKEKAAVSDEAEVRAELRRKLKELKINCPANTGIETMRRKIREAEKK